MLTTYHRILKHWRETTMAKQDPDYMRLLFQLAELRRMAQALVAETYATQERLTRGAAARRQAVKDTVRGMENQ